MNVNQSWSASIGRWMGVNVRIHVLLLLFVALIFSLEWQLSQSMGTKLLGTAAVTSLVLLVSALIHELAHAFAILSLGGRTERLVLTPWGGNSGMRVRADSWSKIVVHLAGPFANVGVFLIVAAILMQSHRGSIDGLINPFRPHGFHTSDSVVSSLQIIGWINFQMFLVNLIPCFPFDGAKVVREVLAILDLSDSKYRTESAIMVLGNAVAICFVGIGLISIGRTFGPVGPGWFLLITLGITLFFASRYSYAIETDINSEENAHMHRDWEFDALMSDAGLLDLDTGEHDIYLDPDLEDYEFDTPSQWMTEKQEERLRDRQLHEEQEERQADEVLKKLHDGGITSLTDDERALLQRVSARIRRRRDQSQEVEF